MQIRRPVTTAFALFDDRFWQSNRCGSEVLRNTDNKFLRRTLGSWVGSGFRNCPDQPLSYQGRRVREQDRDRTGRE